MGGDHVSKFTSLSRLFSPAAEKATVKWILKLGDYGFSPRADILMGLMKKEENVSLEPWLPEVT